MAKQAGNSPKPSDQRADVKNPNNPKHQQAADNRSVQLNTRQGKRK